MSTLTVGPADIVEDLDTIALDELVADAALTTRVDRKYLVPVAHAGQLVRGLGPVGARVLRIDGHREFGYRSEYYDTADLDCFYDAGQRRRRRFKVRTRHYLDTDGSYLEVKTRGPRGLTVKDRVQHDGLGLDRFALAFISDVLSRNSIEAPAELEQSLVNEYRRITLHLPGREAARVTLDSRLSFAAPSGASVPPGLGGLMVVETKSGAVASDADRILWRMGHRPIGLSKYGLGLLLTRPDLRHLKWHRVLQQLLG
ncbi:MAG: VTC domain-containing protein [Actinomycetales bacterium]